MAAPAQVLAQSHNVARSNTGSLSRVLVVDALRGLALLAMALDHAAFFIGTGLQAESYGGAAVNLQSFPYWFSGLITNLAAPIFWLLSGVSLALYEAGRRRRGDDESAISRFMLIRAAVILVLDLTVCAIAWRGDYPYVHVLTTMAITMAILALLRYLPTGAILAIGLGTLLGYQGWLMLVGPTMAEATTLGPAIWLGFSYVTVPAIGFSVLGWGPLMVLGFVIGRKRNNGARPNPQLLLHAGLALLGFALCLRLIGGYGDFGPFGQIGDSAAHWLIMSKAPPSLSFFAFNLGLAALIAAFASLRPALLERAPLNWLALVGQTSLGFYVAHLWVYHLVAALVEPLNLPIIALAKGYLVFALGLLLLLPICLGYRRLRKAYPQSVLRYL
ncbi:MAG: succinyl transferase OpgC [Oscillochloris sp.]|nr:succinyl transferase OpgC [Oscillochloris sp.]